MKPIRQILADQKGAYFLMSAIVLGAMVGFAALGVEIGRWYGIQAEISKSIDGAAFAGAKNVSNPKFPTDADLEGFVLEVAQANFPPGLLDTDTPIFVAQKAADGKVTVNGNVHSLNHMTTVFDTGTAMTNLGAVGAAKLRKAEVALVLDVSGSMDAGGAIDDLKTGADTFVNNFQSFQKDHKFALISYATGVQTPVPLSQDFVFDMTTEIGNLNATGGTNTEDALGQAVNLPWEPGQLALPANERTRQVVILFSDGNPSGYRAQFKYNGADLDAVALLTGSPPNNVYGQLGKHDEQVNYFTNNADDHGDGKTSGSSACGASTTKWYIFQDPTYGIATYGGAMGGYSFEDCNVQESPALVDYTVWLTRQMAIDHAAELKAMGITVYTIGLGSVDQSFLETLATDTAHAYFANDPADLEGIFQTIANKLKLILVS